MGFKSSLTQILTIIAAVVLVGCASTESHVSQTAKAPDISIQEAARTGNIEAVKQHLKCSTVNQQLKILDEASLEGD